MKTIRNMLGLLVLAVVLGLATAGPAPAQSSDQMRLALGIKGAVYTTDTGAVTGSFGRLYALEATVVGTLVAPQITGTLTSVPIPAGGEIVGYIDGYTLASGKVLAYKR